MKAKSQRVFHMLSLTAALLAATGIAFGQQGGGGQGGGNVDRGGKDKMQVRFTQSKSVLVAGESFQFQARLVNQSGEVQETQFEWSVMNGNVGEITQDGLFMTLSPGHTRICAKSGEMMGTAEVVVRADGKLAQNQAQGLRVVVAPNNTQLDVGETVLFTASLLDSSGAEQPTEFAWSADEGGFGVIDATGLFTAAAKGHGFVYATAGELSGRAHVVIQAPGTRNGGPPVTPRQGSRMVIVPNDTLVLIGNDVVFQAYLEDRDGGRTEVYPEWELKGKHVGAITENGLFTADSSGNAVLKAGWETYSATARVRVATADDTANAKQSGFAMKNREGGQVGNVKRVAESDVFRISGMPFPLNILNGAEVSLPVGALAQDVTIDVSIPGIAEVKSDTVNFPDLVLTGISFDVYVNGEKVSPYVFDEPVLITVPYKPELIDSLGLTLDDLWMFFYTEEGEYLSDGLFDLVVDSTRNKVYIYVSHFSEIILGDKKLEGTTSVAGTDVHPAEFVLYENFPNPFNPETLVRFSVGGDQARELSLTIYNLLGREIRMLVRQSYAPGMHSVQWNGLDNAGRSVGSGIYFYRLKGDGLSLTRRMTLIK